MQKLELEESISTPFVLLDPATGLLEITGTSTPEDSFAYYKPIFNWLDNYIASPNESTKLTIKLDYFNTSSSKCVLNILKKIEKLYQSGYQVEVMWHYHPDDKDMIDIGTDLQSILKVPFQLKQTEKPS
jgi:hypothetical protein